MTKKQILFQRIVSADGKNIAEACSEASAFGNNGSTISQSVTVKTASDHSSSSSSSSSTSSS
jgi:hypothetical protein